MRKGSCGHALARCVPAIKSKRECLQPRIVSEDKPVSVVEPACADASDDELGPGKYLVAFTFDRASWLQVPTTSKRVTQIWCASKSQPKLKKLPLIEQSRPIYFRIIAESCPRDRSKPSLTALMMRKSQSICQSHALRKKACLIRALRAATSFQRIKNLQRELITHSRLTQPTMDQI